MAVITKAKKIELSNKLVEDITSGDIIFVSFEGLDFAKIQGLRSKLKEIKANFKVVRNSILYFAAKSANIIKEDKKPDYLKGPTAVIFVKDTDEISKVAKILIEFSKENPQLRVKGGFVSKDHVTPEFLKEISKLGSKKDIIAAIVSSLYGSLANLRSVVEAPIRDLVYVLEDLKKKKESQGNP